jgi:glycolate oxidase FAD binding subunit
MSDAASHALRSALAPLLSEEYVLSDSDSCAAYAIQGVVPALVVAPGDIDELAAILRVAQEQRAAVVPWGGGTQQAIGAPPRRAAIVVRLERLNRVLIHEPADLTISVEAGMRLGALREYLAQHGQMLPIDPPLPAQATIGGLIATAADGPRRLGYGVLRDLLVGITVVESGGRISRAGGMVVKNVSGFDMMKLYLGSFGTLAVIASANFKLLPAPRGAASLLCTFNGASDAFNFIEALQLTQLTPTAAEYLNRGALQVLEFDGVCAVALRAEGLPLAVERHIQEMAALARRHNAVATTHYASATDSDLWARIADLPQTAQLADDEVVVKLTALPSELDRTLARLEQLAESEGAQLMISARAMNGIVYVRLRALVPARLRAIIQDTPGIQWVATRIADVPQWGAPSGLDVMRRIKSEFDPLGLLNPGRFVDGM